MSFFLLLQCKLLLQKKGFFSFLLSMFATHVYCNTSSNFFSYYTHVLQCMLVVQKNKRKCMFSSSSSCCNVKIIKLFFPYCVNDYFVFSIDASFSFCFEGFVRDPMRGGRQQPHQSLDKGRKYGGEEMPSDGGLIRP